MSISRLRQQLKPWILPIAMLCGLLFHREIEAVAFLAPWLIFVMLFITFCRVKPSEFTVSPMLWRLLLVQIVAAVCLYMAIAPFNTIVAQGVFICFFCPTATAAPVITGMLGGSIPRLVSYSLISNIAVAILAPVIFARIGSAQVDFLADCVSIGIRVVPLILVPLAAALVLRYVAPGIHAAVAQRQSLSFYVWAVSLIIVAGRSVSFVMAEPPSEIPVMLVIAFAALIACCAQFYVGRRIGGHYGDRVSGGQSLGQKNTVLAIWMALTYLNPLSSVGPAAYIVWQNTINSLQLYRHMHSKTS